MIKRLLLSSALLLAIVPSAFATESSQPIVMAQANNTDYRVSVLEEQVRQLTGKVEELNFQILELQELIRRMQEDNEFRFQQLEEKRGSLSSGENDTARADEGSISLEKPEPSEQQAGTAATGGNESASTSTTKRTIDGVELYDGEGGLDTNLSRTLGTIQFDADGNIVDTTLGKPLDLTALPTSPDLPQDPDSLFQAGYDLVQTGRYEEAESALLNYSEQFPNHPRLPEARFWLGESYLGRGQYREAAEVYLDVQKRWPNSKFGPQSLLKLGVSVAGMNQRELACATFAEVLQKYPDSSRAIRRNVAFEQRAAKCATN